jgi:hypothetical protein
VNGHAAGFEHALIDLTPENSLADVGKLANELVFLVYMDRRLAADIRPSWPDLPSHLVLAVLYL